jgi:hypothetical protein
MKDIFKSMAWGALLLICALGILVSGILLIEKSDDFVDKHIATKAKLLNQEITLRVLELENLYLLDSRSSTDIIRIEQLKAKLKASIRVDIEKICDGCDISYFPNTSWEAHNIIRDLELMSDPRNIDRKNTAIGISLFFSALMFLKFSYLSVALFKFKTLNANGIAFLALLVFPWILFSFYMSTLAVSKYYSYDTSLGLWWVIAPIIYIFLVYPALWRYASSRKLSIKSLVKLKGK